MSEIDLTSSDTARDAGRCTIDSAIAGLERLRDSLDGSFDAAAAALVSCPGKVLTLGIGKSAHAAQKAAATLRSIGLPAVYLNASDALHGDLGVVNDGDVAVLFSKSGTTRELTVLMPHLRSRGATLVGIMGTRESPLGRACDHVIHAVVEREGCPLDAAPMASALAAQAAGDALAAAVMKARGFTTEDFARLHPAGALGARLTLNVRDVMRTGEELPTVDASATLRDAVIEITRTGFGAVCVTADQGRLEGFITDGDVRRWLLGDDHPASVPVADVMTSSPLSVTPDLPVSQALLLLEQRKKAYMAAPVVDDDGQVVGLLRLHDAVQAHLPQ